jgi:hypothetical protein
MLKNKKMPATANDGLKKLHKEIIAILKNTPQVGSFQHVSIPALRICAQALSKGISKQRSSQHGR